MYFPTHRDVISPDPNNVSAHEKAVADFKVKKASSPSDLLELCGTDESPTVRARALTEMIKSDANIEQIQRDRPKQLLELMRNEPNEHLYGPMMSMALRSLNPEFYAAAVECLRELAITGESEWRRYCANYALGAVLERPDKQADWQFVADHLKDRALTDKSNYVRALAANGLLTANYAGDGVDASEFAEQWFLHTAIPPLLGFQSRPTKIRDYFARESRLLLASEAPADPPSRPRTAATQSSQHVTTELTSRDIKGQKIAASGLFVVGVIVLVVGVDGRHDIGLWMAGISVLWLVYLRGRRWWQHG